MATSALIQKQLFINGEWRDAASGGLVQQRQEAGLGHREDLVTFFDLMDAEEGRLP